MATNPTAALGATGTTAYGSTTAAAAAADTRTIINNEVSWGAVFAGTVVALVVQALLSLLGAGIGAATFDPMTGDNPTASAFSIGAAIWWTFSGIVAAFIGGYAAGRLSGRPRVTTPNWHGLITWAFTTLFVLALVSSVAGKILGGAMNVLAGAAAGAGGAVAAAAPAVAQAQDPFAGIERQIRETTGSDPQALRDTAVSAMRAAVSGDQAQAQAARQRAAEAIARAQNISADEANQKVAQYEQQYRDTVAQAKQKATAAADTAAKATTGAATFAFIALLLGALAGWFGGHFGAVGLSRHWRTEEI